MSPQAALDSQIEHYREMTDEERLAIPLGLHELCCDIERNGIQHPGADEAGVEWLLRRRLELVRGM